MNWNALIDESAFGALLPREYAEYARPVLASLATFLESLPESIQREIFQSQIAAPTASASQRLGLLAARCPVLQKLGQVLARDQRLAAELRAELRELESTLPATPKPAIESVLRQELGSLEDRGVQLGEAPIAEASVAVVIPFSDSSAAAAGRPVEGVFKVLKPGVEERLTLELQALGRVGEFLDASCRDLGVPALDYAEVFAQVRDKLQWELRLDEEQRHLAAAYEIYRDDAEVVVPQVLPYCTPRVTAMQRVYGVKVTDHTLTGERRRRRLANLVARSLISQPIFSRAPLALFHGDPHAGNLFFTDDGRLALLDWSLAGFLGEPERAAITQIVISALTLQPAKIASVLEELSERPPDRSALQQAAERAVAQVRRGRFPGLHWLLGLLDEAAQQAGLRVAGDLVLFRKSLLTLDGVIAELGSGGFQHDAVLLEDFLKNFAAEWPTRWISTPGSREFATRLSNADLARVMLGFPWTVGRFWTQEGAQLLQKFRAAVASPITQ